MKHLSIRIIILSTWLGIGPLLGQSIGSGNPGLKIATRKSDAVVIYQDEPQTVGVGLQGGMLNRKITVIFDKNYHFDQKAMDVPHDLYPFDAETAFTNSGGNWASAGGPWNHTPRQTIGYRLSNGELTTFENVQRAAEVKYNLQPNEIFLGFINDMVFFWKDFNTNFVFWRKQGNQQLFKAKLPKGIIEIYGAAKGIKKDIGFMVFRKTPGLIHWYPRTWDFVEIQLAKGKLVNAP